MKSQKEEEKSIKRSTHPGSRHLLIIVTSPYCKYSKETLIIAKQICKELNLRIKEVSINTKRGLRYAMKKGLNKTPGIILDGKKIWEGVIDRDLLLKILKGKLKLDSNV